MKAGLAVFWVVFALGGYKRHLVAGYSHRGGRSDFVGGRAFGCVPRKGGGVVVGGRAEGGVAGPLVGTRAAVAPGGAGMGAARFPLLSPVGHSDPLGNFGRARFAVQGGAPGWRLGVVVRLFRFRKVHGLEDPVLLARWMSSLVTGKFPSKRGVGATWPFPHRLLYGALGVRYRRRGPVGRDGIRRRPRDLGYRAWTWKRPRGARLW